jgi:hypothetical protein
MPFLHFLFRIIDERVADLNQFIVAACKNIAKIHDFHGVPPRIFPSCRKPVFLPLLYHSGARRVHGFAAGFAFSARRIYN